MKLANMSTKIQIGDAILLTNNRRGIVRYHGKTRFGSGYWFGIELTDCTITRHNGMVLNKRYFLCPSNKGLFIRRDCIIKVFHNEHKHSNILKIKQPKKHKIKPRTPKYKLEKEKQRIKSLALIASQNKPIPSTKSEKQKTIIKKHKRQYNHIPINNIPNECLSDNESIEISSDEAAMNQCAIVIERNLINYGEKEQKNIFLDKYIDNLNDIEYSLSVSVGNGDGYKNNENALELIPGENNNKYNLIEMQKEYTNVNEQYEQYEADNEYYDYDNDWPIEGRERIYSEKENLLTRKHLFYLVVNRAFVPFFVYGAINALIVYGIYAFFNSYNLQLYWTIRINMNELLNVNGDMDDLPWVLLCDLFITTVLESVSIMFFIKMLVEKDLKSSKITRLDDEFDISDFKCCLFCIFRLIRNGLVLQKNNNNISCCQKCGRKVISALMCVILAIIILFIPMAFILCVFVGDKFMSLDVIQMMMFKAGFAGIIALILSPITAFLVLI